MTSNTKSIKILLPTNSYQAQVLRSEK